MPQRLWTRDNTCVIHTHIRRLFLELKETYSVRDAAEIL
jgi:hypothetical protein